MKKNYFLSSLAAVTTIGALMLSSCSPITPEARIEKNPTMFENLPQSQQELVKQGKIKKGMHKDGVFLAWGKAQSVTQGNKDGKNYERWVYTSATPTYHHGINPYFGYGLGRRGWGRGGYYGVGINPGVSYMQTKRASVSFNSYDKVDSWESRR